MKKVCRKCNIERDISEFCKSKANSDGLQSYCKKCMRKIREKSYKANKEINSERAKEYYKNNKDKINLKQIEYRKNNYDKISSKKKEWTKKNREKINQRQRFRQKHDYHYKIRKNLSSRLSEFVRYKYRSESVKYIVGCSISELKKHLENQFTKGMTWDNYSLKGWHIDHIKPCASFDLTDIEQQKECFHYTNLQPLWAKDNLIKSDKIL